ncbi:hypothetical protein N836_22725 [Leptolyngbya sp. Heron Island J]|uniref:DUF4335 domain-containing protein n=1 Tax=Leptolyngbya sp. Heron Island J TaxID=1385935 RepID=UPI0003B973AE|nr:DUF4335 domain-containing protein [Leptolyngbya sp. Heron Island J]ESA33209.1 hypothetical protein N836_22725 [Leptolyngbya sp. Heron Island J]
MSPVLPINTQRYRSGNYMLEVTAQPSPLSQWSDRPVVRRLRFSLWLERPERQQLAAGNQQQLVALSDAVETYVQTYLSQQAWPQTHSIKLLDRTIKLSTIQLFNLAEVLSAYGQRHITLPVAALRRRRRSWQTGSAVASLLVAVGVTTAYLYYRPPVFNEVATTQAPEAVFEDGVSSPPSSPAAPELESAPAEPSFNLSQELAQQPLDQEELDGVSTIPAAPQAAGANAPSAAETQIPDIAEQDLGPGEDKLSALPEASEPMTTAEVPGQLETQESLKSPAASAASDLAQRSQLPDDPVVDDALLAAIATQLAPYQPTDTAYPLVYHLQIAADGTIVTLDPMSEDAPNLEIPANIKTQPPGRSLQVEIIYTGSARPTVRERF